MSFASESAPSIFTRMGKLLNMPLTSETDTFRAVHQGITSKTYVLLARTLSFPVNLVAPESTVRRRIAADDRFSEAESERIVRVARVFAEAVELFGDESQAIAWFKRPAEYLLGEPEISPMSLSASDTGARIIESHIRRTANGIY